MLMTRKREIKRRALGKATDQKATKAIPRLKRKRPVPNIVRNTILRRNPNTIRRMTQGVTMTQNIIQNVKPNMTAKGIPTTIQKLIRNTIQKPNIRANLGKSPRFYRRVLRMIEAKRKARKRE